MPNIQQISADAINSNFAALQTALDSAGSTVNFSMNSGNVNSSGNADLLAYSGGTLSTKTDGTYPNAVGTNASGTLVTLSETKTLDMSSYLNGTYNVLLKADGTLEAYINTIYTKKYEPTQLTNSLNSTNTGCAISNGVATASSGAYILLPSAPSLSTASSWEFKTKYTFITSSSYPTIIGSSTSNYYGFPTLYNVSGALCVCLTSTGSNWNIASNTSTGLSMVNGTTYYFKFGYDGTQYYLKYNTDGSENYTTQWTLTSSFKAYVTVAPMLMNMGYNLSTYYSAGSMDLTKTSIKINGSLWWEAYPTIKSDDIWLNTSTDRLAAKKYDGSAWSDYDGIPIGTVTVTNGTVSTVTTNPYNQNGYVVNSQTQGYRFPDYKNGISKVWNTLHTAECDGWINVGSGVGNTENYIYITINGVQLIGASNAGPNGFGAYSFLPVSKGDKYIVSGGYSFYTLVFYPAK